MNRKVKKLWLEALRSGEYRQTYGRLRTRCGNSFCCLGVLCDLHRKEHKDMAWKYTAYIDTETALPNAVMKWAGLKQQDPKINGGKDLHGVVIDTLSRLNDLGRPFSKIADIIQSQL